MLKEKFEIVAVVDSNENMLNEMYSGEDICRCVSAADVPVDFDIALVCVPHTMHAKITLPLLNSGKVVIKEKPLATSIEEANLYNENMNLFTIVQKQFNPMFIKGKEKIESIGRIYNYNYSYNLPFAEMTKGWRANFDISQGGVLLDMGYHVLDILLTYFGNRHWLKVFNLIATLKCKINVWKILFLYLCSTMMEFRERLILIDILHKNQKYLKF